MRQLSPMRSWRSTISVSMPSCCSRAAIDNPAWPPPTTSTAGSRSAKARWRASRSDQFSAPKSRVESGSARRLNSSSWPRSSCKLVFSVQARRRPWRSGTRRRMPLPGPKAVVNSKIASRHCVPARATQRGGVRFGGMRKFAGCVRASVSRSAASIAGLPAMVWMVQVKASRSRQSPSARNSAAAAAASCARKAASKPASQVSASASGVRRGRSSTMLIAQPGLGRSDRCAPPVVRVASYCNAAACTMRGRQIRRACRGSGRKP